MRVLVLSVKGIRRVIQLGNMSHHLVNDLTLVLVMGEIGVYLQPLTAESLNDLSVHRKSDVVNQVVSNVLNPLELVTNGVGTRVVSRRRDRTIEVLQWRPNIWKRQ